MVNEVELFRSKETLPFVKGHRQGRASDLVLKIHVLDSIFNSSLISKLGEQEHGLVGRRIVEGSELVVVVLSIHLVEEVVTLVERLRPYLNG